MLSPRFRPLFGLSTLALLAAGPALAQEAPVRAVTLFEAGLAELTRDTGTAREVTLSVPLRDVNDVLKSLLLRGDGITGGHIAADDRSFQPMNINYGLLPPLEAPEKDAAGKRLKAKERGVARKRLMSRRALADIEAWLGRAPAHAAAE